MEQIEPRSKKVRGLAKATLEMIEQGQLICEQCAPISVRGIAYKLLPLGFIDSMKQVGKVSRVMVKARERGFISWGDIVDETRELEREASWDDPEHFMRCASLSYRRDYWNGQRHIVEVWSEKGTVRGVLQPILDEFGVGLRVMHGFTSATVVKSIANVRKPIIALYVGDYDPSGMHMSEIDLPDRLVEYGGEHHRVIRIGLLDHDIEDLPSIAAKPTDPRFKWYSANYGKQAWELDALDPNVLRDRVRRAILSKIDQDEWDRSRLCRRTLGAGKERRDDQRERRFRARRLNRPRSCSRPPSRSKYASTGTSSTFDPLLVPDGLSNGKQGRQCEGLNPMEIDPAMLTAGGHPPRRTRDVVAAYKRVMGGDCFSASAERVQRHKDIRAVCLECLDENAAEVCRCTTFWCPFWPYRMGRNPHNPARGRNPFRPKKG